MSTLPPLPQRDLLTDLCKEAATVHRVSPAAVEKDFFLTRLIWALAQRFENKLLLKGGTLLSKVDLGYHRMSEDVDLVIPLEGRPDYKPSNAKAMNKIRDALKALAPDVGLAFTQPDGHRYEKHRHVVWELPYSSAFGPQAITLEASIRPVLRPARKAPLNQLLNDPLAGDYRHAYCWALDLAEAVAEKVRAACTRTAGRDFYDLALLEKRGTDLTSQAFLELVDAKLAELAAPPMSAHKVPFDLTGARLSDVRASLLKDLPAVVRVGEPDLELDGLLKIFSERWGKSPA